jgi:hypothetical protein
MRQKFETSHAIRVPSTIDHPTQHRVASVKYVKLPSVAAFKSTRSCKASVKYVKLPNVAAFKSTRSCKAPEDAQISAVSGAGTRDDEPTISDILKMDNFAFRFD